MKECYNIRHMNKNKSFGTIALFSASILWGAAFVFQSKGMNYMGPFTFTAVRIGIGAFSVRIVQILVEKKQAFEYSRKTLTCGVVCGLITFAVIVLQQIGLTKTEPGKAGFITSLYIMIVPVLGTLVFKQKEPAKTWIGVAGGLVGLYLLCVPEGEAFAFQTTDLLIMGCAFFFACHVLFIDRFCDGTDPLALNYIQLAVTSLLSLLCAFIFEEPSWGEVTAGWIPIAYCGIVSAGIGYTLQIVGQKSVEPTVASIIMALEAVFSVLFGWLILKDALSVRELVGCGIMLGASILIQLPQKGEMKLHQDNVQKIT